MEVILLEPVRKLGNVGDVVKVRNGYARNYLIPTNKALRSTKDNISYFESRKSEIEKENQKKLAEAEKTAKEIDESFIVLIRQAGEDGRLYGSVTSLDIARELIEKSKQQIDRKQVTLSAPIKYIGIYEIEIHLIGEVSAKVNVNIARTESEAKDTEKRFRKGEKVMEGPDSEEEKIAEKKEGGQTKKDEIRDAGQEAETDEVVAEGKEKIIPQKAAAKKKSVKEDPSSKSKTAKAKGKIKEE